jgi:transposase InsO family protein
MAKEQLHKRLTREFVEEVLAGFHEGRLSETKACQLFEIKRTQLYDLRKRWLRCKGKGAEFNLYNRKTSAFHKFPDKAVKFFHEELKYIRDEAQVYNRKFNFEFIAQKAEVKFGKHFHRDSIRRFALREGYYTATPEEKEKVYVRFETSGPGALFQHDTSFHLWLPDTGIKNDVILTKDDHTRAIVGARIVEQETAWDHLCVARKTFESYGLPLAYYVDKHSLFKFVRYGGIHNIQRVVDEEAQVQFRRALNSLGTGIIYANSPQAKGKIERIFDYVQRRLPSECERYNIRNVEGASKILDDIVYFYNNKKVHSETQEIPIERWNRATKEGKSKIRAIPQDKDLDAIFSLQCKRKVKKDGTISYKGRIWKVGRFPEQEVTVCLIPDKKIIVLKDEQKIGEYQL